MADSLGPTAVGALEPPAAAPDADAVEEARLKLKLLRADADKAEQDVARAKRELDKLDADITKARVEAAAAPAAPRLERMRVYLAAVTSLGALLTVGGIVFQQQAQTAAQLRTFTHADSLQREADRRDAASKRAADVAALMREYGRTADPSVRIAAITGLAAYGSDPALRPSIQRLLIKSMRVTDAPEVRDAAFEKVVGMSDSSALAALAEANRRVRYHIRDHLVRRSTAGGVDEQTDFSDLRLETWDTEALAADTVLARLVRDLEWYADALTRAINAVGIIRRQNFRNVYFTPLRRDGGPARSGVPTGIARTGLQVLFRPGLRFSYVDFRGAVIAEQLFAGATFDTAFFQDAALPDSRFEGSVLRHVNLISVRPYIGGESGIGMAPGGSAVVLDSCVFEHSRVAPRVVQFGSGVDLPPPPSLRLYRTRWVRMPTTDPVFGDSLPSDTGAVAPGGLVIPRSGRPE